MKLISFVVPVLNGSRVLKRFYDRMIPVCRSIGRYEMIFVDDGSVDESFKVLAGLVEQNRNVTAIRLSRNFGQHNATLAGLARSKGDVVVTLDQDLQNPPEEISTLLDKLEEGFDVVYGLPAVRAHGFFRNATSDFSKWISGKILSTSLKGNFSSFRAIRKWVVQEIVKYRSHYVYIDGLISWTTANVGGVTVRNDRSEYGSQYTVLRLINHGLNLLVNFSIRPLQIASVIGTASSILGLIAAVLVILDKLIYGVQVQGWASLMVVVLVIGGVQLVFLGLIGEYVGRILMNSNTSPNYVVREIRNKKSKI